MILHLTRFRATKRFAVRTLDATEREVIRMKPLEMDDACGALERAFARATLIRFIACFDIVGNVLWTVRRV